MSDEKLSLIEAEGKLEAITQTAKEAEANYISMATLDAPDAERQAAYGTLIEARQTEKAAKEQVLKAQAEAGDPVGYDTIDIIEATDRAISKIKGSLSGRKVLISCAEDALREIRLSLSEKPEEGSAQRFVAYSDLYKRILHDDRGFALFAHEAEKLGRSFARKQLENTAEGKHIELLRNARKEAVDTDQLAGIDKELAEFLEKQDSAVDEQIAGVLATESPETSKLFLDNRIAYNFRKMAGFKSLMES